MRKPGDSPTEFPRQVLARVHPREDVDEANRVHVENRCGFGVVPDLGRVPRDGEDVLHP